MAGIVVHNKSGSIIISKHSYQTTRLNLIYNIHITQLITIAGLVMIVWPCSLLLLLFRHLSVLSNLLGDVAIGTSHFECHTCKIIIMEATCSLMLLGWVKIFPISTIKTCEPAAGSYISSPHLLDLYLVDGNSTSLLMCYNLTVFT